MDPLLGTIILFAGNFAPRGWAFCHGQILPIAQNTALFSILGTTYGGDGRTTFALPDLRGRVPVGQGQGPGLSPIQLGERGGSSTVTLTQAQMPAHVHTATSTLPVSAANARVSSPVGNVLAVTPDEIYGPPSSATDSTAVSTTVDAAGGSQPVSVMPPYLGMNYIIALQGIYPSRD